MNDLAGELALAVFKKGSETLGHEVLLKEL
jgi:hypothetical protein